MTWNKSKHGEIGNIFLEMFPLCVPPSKPRQSLMQERKSSGGPQWFMLAGWKLTWLNYNTWWRHQMETVSALLAICAGNSSVPGEFPAQRPVTRGFDVFFDLRPDKRLSKQSWGWWFEKPSHSLWRHRNEFKNYGDVMAWGCFSHYSPFMEKKQLWA